MFCPNCGSKNSIEQNYCRGCGLKLDAVVEAVSGQFPSDEFVELQRRREMFQRIGMFCLAVAGFVGFALLLFKAAQYKAELFGEDVLVWSAISALVGFLVLSVFFFNYPKFFLKEKNVAPFKDQKDKMEWPVTAKLIEDRPFESASSVTESTTDLLEVTASKRKT